MIIRQARVGHIVFALTKAIDNRGVFQTAVRPFELIMKEALDDEGAVDSSPEVPASWVQGDRHPCHEELDLDKLREELAIAENYWREAEVA